MLRGRKFKLNIVILLALSLLLLTVAGFAENKKVEPPKAKIKPVKITKHGDTRVDNYYWLKEKKNPEVIKYLEAENVYTKAMMKQTEKLQQKLFIEMKSRIMENDIDVPVKMGDYYYYTKTEKGKQYDIFCRKKGSLDAKEEAYLDLNILSKGHEYLSIDDVRISPDNNKVAYLMDIDGSEQFILQIKDLVTGKTLPDKVTNTYYGLEWGNDNKTLFYTTLDEAKRPYKVFRHTLGTDAEKDKLVYHEKDDMFYLALNKTKDKRFLLIEIGSQITSEVLYLDADKPNSSFKVFSPRRHKIEYYVAHHGNRFLVTTNDNALNFKIMETPECKTSHENWKEIIAHDEKVIIEDIDVFKNYIAIYQRSNALEDIVIWDLKSDTKQKIPMDEALYSLKEEDNPDFDSSKLRYKYSSFVTPETIYDYDMSTNKKELKKRTEVPGGYNPANYEMKQLWATAKDGTKIPMSMVYKKGTKQDGKNGLLLYGYGSYGANYEPRFDSNLYSLIDRGVIYVRAHIRGGGIMGRGWYLDGKFLKKINTFEDFIACGEYLIAEKYTSSDKLAIYGGSAGGLLIGAVINMRPDLFQAAIASVPFVDVVTTMFDKTIPLTVIEFEEWGNPENKEFYDYMLTYSPYDNVENKEYPNLLITAGLNDPRVQYWEPAKWTAKMRTMVKGDNKLLFKVNMGAGHFASSGRYDKLKDIAFNYAFILDSLGITE